MNLADISVRIRRLEQLRLGLARECIQLRKDPLGDPLLRNERMGYLKGIQDAIAGIECARVVLAKARQRSNAAMRAPKQ